jgi:tetratricopeptide (TPR) repeat protein
MRARLDEADRLGNLMFELGTRMGEPDAFSLYAAQLFVIRSFAGRYEELMSLLEDVVAASPDVLPFRLAHAIGCCASGRVEEAAAVLAAGASAGFGHVPADYTWMTAVIGYAVLAIELEDEASAAELYPILEPYGAEVAFNGATSQGHIGAYLGKLASLLGDHDLADDHLHRALAVNLAFGWEYHEATTLVALALSRVRRSGALDDRSAAGLDRAAAIAEERGLALVAAQVARLRAGGGDARL